MRSPPATFWLFTFILGAIILIIPDKTAPVIALNQKHGPSWLDIPGLILILVGWIMLSAKIITQWKKIGLILGAGMRNFLTAIYFISVVALFFALKYGIEWLLYLGAGLAFLVNIILIYVAHTKKYNT